ncbi:MAG: hypothetical protein II877_01695 [Synergistaceae bacterium]|nr:hypothetical protein [Synergistaceae bacterium]
MGAKISLYVKDKAIRDDLAMLAAYHHMTLTEIVSTALSDYLSRNAADIDFLRRQEQERETRRRDNDG